MQCARLGSSPELWGQGAPHIWGTAASVLWAEGADCTIEKAFVKISGSHHAVHTLKNILYAGVFFWRLSCPRAFCTCIGSMLPLLQPSLLPETRRDVGAISF